MDNKELTEEERAGIKKIVNCMAKFVLDEIEYEKRKSNSNSCTKKQVKILADNLNSGFNWDDTEEGHKYWEDVYDRLVRIAEVGF